jgi:hypothetical protein
VQEEVLSEVYRETCEIKAYDSCAFPIPGLDCNRYVDRGRRVRAQDSNLSPSYIEGYIPYLSITIC